MGFKDYLTEATMEIDWVLENGKIDADDVEYAKKFKLKVVAVGHNRIKLTGKVADLKKFSHESTGGETIVDIKK